jgi:hypothetical protein
MITLFIKYWQNAVGEEDRHIDNRPITWMGMVNETYVEFLD